MQTIRVELDAMAFSHEVAIAVSHRYTECFQVEVHGQQGRWILLLSADQLQQSEEAVRAEVLRDALDEQLREFVRLRTQHLHEILIDAALLGARPGARPGGNQ